MRLHDCKVRLSNELANEVRKTNVTAAEILVLRALHGEEAVIDIVKKDMDRRSHAEERAHLWKLYVGTSEGEDLGGFQKGRGDMLRSLFGAKHIPLPVELPEPEVFADIDDEPVVRTVVPAVAGPAEDVAAALAGALD